MTATTDLFLPEPLPREVKYTVISVDDHVVEPPHTFEGRLPAHLQDRAPRVAGAATHLKQHLSLCLERVFVFFAQRVFATDGLVGVVAFGEQLAAQNF